jgi:hypothetical protein
MLEELKMQKTIRMKTKLLRMFISLSILPLEKQKKKKKLGASH